MLPLNINHQCAERQEKTNKLDKKEQSHYVWYSLIIISDSSTYLFSLNLLIIVKEASAYFTFFFSFVNNFIYENCNQQTAWMAVTYSQ